MRSVGICLPLYVCVCLYVCMCVFVCVFYSFSEILKPWPRNFKCGTQAHLGDFYIEFICQGFRVVVKVWQEQTRHTSVANAVVIIMWNKIISKLFQPSSMAVGNYYISATCLKLFRNYFKGLLQLVNIFRHVLCRWNNFKRFQNFFGGWDNLILVL